jgi:hypothetical protein
MTIHKDLAHGTRYQTIFLGEWLSRRASRKMVRQECLVLLNSVCQYER